MSHSRSDSVEARRWWIKLFVQPALFLVCAALVIMGLGVAQRSGLIRAVGSGNHSHANAGLAGARYICPMMCTPPQAEPGRCPVCAMELVPATVGGGKSDARSIHVDPATRRIANIQTVAVDSVPIKRTVRAIGELRYDEGTLKTIAAYVDGRLDRLYADYTGVVVKPGDPLALVYSPRLYSGQIELILAKKSRDQRRSAESSSLLSSNEELYRSAKQRLNLLGMTDQQIAELEASGEANSRLQLCAPIGGTVIEKLAVEGQYIKEGDAIYKLADLSTVWLMLRLFPEDAVTIRYGQKVDAEVQSLAGRRFTGRVAFVDPVVDSKTRTVGVRVVMANPDGLLRVGDYAKATIDVPLSDSKQSLVFDPELANKWISPRHPQVIAESPGDCPICGLALIPTAELGFTANPQTASEALVVPRDAVLMAGSNSVLYVETEPGRFEIRRVVIGATVGDQLVIRSGVQPGEQVATRGNFLIDSQMQLAGNPSLIDPTRLDSTIDEQTPVEMVAALSALSVDDRAQVAKQRICPVGGQKLGSMGIPVKVTVNGTSVFICCENCRQRLLQEPDKYLAIMASASKEKSLPVAPSGRQPMDLPPIGLPQPNAPAQPDSKSEAASGGGPAAAPAKPAAGPSTTERMR